MMKFPDFMVVGGVKCGTTSLYHYLRSHPEVCVPCKESYLFNPIYRQGLPSYAKIYSEEEYKDLFETAVSLSTKAAGEVSSVYLYCYKEVIPEVKRILGDIKIIIILRNPVDRAFSHYSFFARDSRDERTFEDAVEEELDSLSGSQLSPALRYVGMGCYSQQVKAYLDSFSDVKVILFDDFVADTKKTMEDVFRFLGVDPEKGQFPDAVYNASGMPKVKWLQTLFFKPTPVKMRIRQLLIDHVVGEDVFARYIEKMRSKNLKKVSLSLAMRERLTVLYRDDVNELQKVIDRNLSVWIK